MKRKHGWLTLVVIVAFLCAVATMAGGATKKKPPTVPFVTAPIFNQCFYDCCGAVGGNVIPDEGGAPICDFGEPDENPVVEIMLAQYSQCVSSC